LTVGIRSLNIIKQQEKSFKRVLLCRPEVGLTLIQDFIYKVMSHV